MRLTTLTAAAALMLFAAPAFAGQCPVDMKSIDVALAANMTLSQDKKDEVAALRTKGEQQHNSGKHGESVATLAMAKEMLGIM